MLPEGESRLPRIFLARSSALRHLSPTACLIYIKSVRPSSEDASRPLI